jgi:hypothetical protein
MMDENKHDIFEFVHSAPAPESPADSEAPLPSIMISTPTRARNLFRSAVTCIMLTIMGVAILLQMITAFRLMSGTIGFDHPGTSGLDYPGAILMGIVYVVSFFVGSVASNVRKKWIAFGMQAALMTIMAIYFAWQLVNPRT